MTRQVAVMVVMVGVGFVVLTGCVSLASLRASEPAHVATVDSTAPKITRCIMRELDLSLSDFVPTGKEFSLLARCDLCMQGHLYEVTIRQVGESDQVRVELRENSAFVLGGRKSLEQNPALPGRTVRPTNTTPPRG